MAGIDRTGRCTFAKVHPVVVDDHLNINGGSGAPIVATLSLSLSFSLYISLSPCNVVARLSNASGVGLWNDSFEISGIQDRNRGYSGILEDLLYLL